MKTTESSSATPRSSVLLVIHPTRPDALEFAIELIKAFSAEGVVAATNFKEAILGALPYDPLANYEVAVVLGGDGTILRAAELVLGKNIPILGINLGNVGFLAEIQRPSAQDLAQAIQRKNYRGESRLLLNYRVLRNGEELESGWALNELAIERSHSQMAELFVQIDDRPLSRWGCDGVICATPTGSTAYAFSAGGPVLWPEVEAIVVLPLAAHALFSRPMVISPQSVIVVDVESEVARISADGFRTRSIQRNDRVFIERSVERIELLHIESAVFTDRLVAKFKLPIEGWRGE